MQHIVYLTTNLVNNKIYIGVHKTETPYKFDGYLGNSLWVNDSYLINHPKEPFHYAVKKYGAKNFKRKTLKVFDNRQDALDLERWLVDEEFIKRSDTYNITLGGGEPPVYSKTIYQYSMNGEFLKEWNSIREAAIFYKVSDSSIGKAVLEGTPSLKYLWSDTKAFNIKNFHINENKKVTYLYSKNGEFIKEFNSITECANFLEKTPSRVQHCIKGKICINKQWYVSDTYFQKFLIPTKESHKNQPVYQYDLNGNFIKEFPNQKAIAEFLGLKSCNVNNSIKQGHSYHGFQWSYEKVPFMKELKPKSGRVRKVGRYSLEGELLETFNSVNEAKRTWGSSAVGCLRGSHKTCRGYIFKYIE